MTPEERSEFERENAARSRGFMAKCDDIESYIDMMQANLNALERENERLRAELAEGVKLVDEFTRELSEALRLMGPFVGKTVFREGVPSTAFHAVSAFVAKHGQGGKV